MFATLLDVCCNLSLVFGTSIEFCDYGDYTIKYLEIKASVVPVNHIFMAVYP